MTIAAPFTGFESQVRPEWIDSNDHMNLAYYVLLFDQATDAIYEAIGLGRDYRATDHGTFAAEVHTIHAAELVLGDRVRISSQILALDAKRLHLAHEMVRLSDGALACCQELMLLHVDLGRRKVVPWLPAVAPRLQAAAACHAALPSPAWAGRRIERTRRGNDGPA